MRKTQVMAYVLAPQAARIMLPAIVSQCVVVLKDTALGGVIIGLPDLIRRGRDVYVNEFNIIPTAVVVAAVFHRTQYGPVPAGRPTRTPPVTEVRLRSRRASRGGAGHPLNRYTLG